MPATSTTSCHPASADTASTQPGHVGELVECERVEFLASAGTCHTLNRPVPESRLSAVS
jgi:hypothetical protein